MGDVRYEEHYRRISAAANPSKEISTLSDEAVIAALAAAVSAGDPYFANVLATEAMNRVRRVRTIMDHLAEGVVAVNPEGYLTFVNPAAERLLGWNEQELLGTHLHNRAHVHESDGKPMPIETCPIHLVLETGEPQTRRNHGDAFARKNGERFPIAITSAPIRREGEIVGVACIFRDVTEERRAEQALRESEERFRALSEAASEAILIHQGGRTLEVNQAFTRMVGYEAHEAIGRSVLDFVAPEYRDQAREILVKRPEEPYALRVLRKDGSTFRAHIAGKNIHYRGEPARVIAVREDEPRGHA